MFNVEQKRHSQKDFCPIWKSLNELVVFAAAPGRWINEEMAVAALIGWEFRHRCRGWLHHWPIRGQRLSIDLSQVCSELFKTLYCVNNISSKSQLCCRGLCSAKRCYRRFRIEFIINNIRDILWLLLNFARCRHESFQRCNFCMWWWLCLF